MLCCMIYFCLFVFVNYQAFLKSLVVQETKNFSPPSPPSPSFPFPYLSLNVFKFEKYGQVYDMNVCCYLVKISQY